MMKYDGMTETGVFSEMIKSSLKYLDDAIQQSARIEHPDPAWLNSVLADAREYMRILKAEAEAIHDHEIRKKRQIEKKEKKQSESNKKPEETAAPKRRGGRPKKVKTLSKESDAPKKTPAKRGRPKKKVE